LIYVVIFEINKKTHLSGPLCGGGRKDDQKPRQNGETERLRAIFQVEFLLFR
jgi:hypothetical protein